MLAELGFATDGRKWRKEVNPFGGTRFSEGTDLKVSMMPGRLRSIPSRRHVFGTGRRENRPYRAAATQLYFDIEK